MARPRSSLFGDTRGRWSPVGMHAAIVMPSVLGAAAGWSPGLVLAAGGALVTVGYLLLAVIEGRKAPLIVSPLSLYFASSWIGLGIAGVWMAWLVNDGTAFVPFAVSEVRVADAASGYAIYLVGSLSYHAGISALRPLENPEEVNGRGKFPRVAFLALWAAGIGFRSGSIFGTLGVLSSMFQWASAAALAAYALSSSPQERRRPLFLSVLSFGSLIEFLLGLDSGSKGIAMFAFFPALWLLTQARDMRKWLLPAGAGVAALYFGVVLPVVTTSREMSVGERVSALQLLGSPEGMLVNERGDAGIPLEALLSRAFDSVAVGYLVEEVRLSGHRETPLGTLQVALIPRVFWAEKPTTSQGAYFDGLVGRVGGQNSLGLTAPGELYWGFGISGVILGMVLIGAGVGLLWRFAGTTPAHYPVRMWAYVSVTMSVGDISSEATGPFVGVISRLLFFGLLLALGRALHPGRAEAALGSQA